MSSPVKRCCRTPRVLPLTQIILKITLVFFCIPNDNDIKMLDDGDDVSDIDDKECQ